MALATEQALLLWCPGRQFRTEIAVLNTPLRPNPAMWVLAGLMLASPALAKDGSGQEWGARDPGSCTEVQLNAAPTPEQVVSMLRCKLEVVVYGELWLMENVKVSVGKATPFVEAYGNYPMEDGDVESTAYNIRGSFTWSVCKTKADAAIYGEQDRNCYEQDVPEAKGVCWQTTFGDYRCRIAGPMSGSRQGTPPPQ